MVKLEPTYTKFCHLSITSSVCPIAEIAIRCGSKVARDVRVKNLIAVLWSKPENHISVDGDQFHFYTETIHDKTL